MELNWHMFRAGASQSFYSNMSFIQISGILDHYIFWKFLDPKSQIGNLKQAHQPKLKQRAQVTPGLFHRLAVHLSTTNLIAQRQSRCHISSTSVQEDEKTENKWDIDPQILVANSPAAARSSAVATVQPSRYFIFLDYLFNFLLMFLPFLLCCPLFFSSFKLLP